MTKFRILYVEDNPELLALVQMLLEKELPAVVDVCATAYGAEAMLNRNCYDLLICDVNLPGELGTTVVEKVLERDIDQPVMLMSEYRSQEIKDEVARISTRFQKPVPLMAKFSEISCPLSFVQSVRDKLRANFCEERAYQMKSPQQIPTSRIRITSKCVKAARAAIAA